MLWAWTYALLGWDPLLTVIWPHLLFSGIGEASFLDFIRLSECLPGAHRPGRHCAGSWGQLLFTLSVLMHHEHFYWVPERVTLSHIQSCAMEPLAILTCPPTEHALSCRSVTSRRWTNCGRIPTLCLKLALSGLEWLVSLHPMNFILLCQELLWNAWNALKVVELTAFASKSPICCG